MTHTTPPASDETRPYHIAMRDPARVPIDEIDLPAPPRAPDPPAGISLLTLILPPVIMIAGSIISALLMDRPNLLVILPLILTGLGVPIASVKKNKKAGKKYTEAMEERRASYAAILRQYRSRIEGLIELQRAALNQAYPPVEKTLAIGMATEKSRRLWGRCPQDLDFLSLRLGTMSSSPSITINLPDSINDEDPLNEMSRELSGFYERIDGLPFLVDLKQAGSLALCSSSFSQLLCLTRRLIADVMVYHSPEDVELFVLADRINASEDWEWLGLAPHAHTSHRSHENQHLLFTTHEIHAFLDHLKTLHLERLEQINSCQGNKAGIPAPARIVLLDDSGLARGHDAARRLAAEGLQTGIYLIFLGDIALPDTCRARIDVETSGQIHFLESIQADNRNRRSGQTELLAEDSMIPLTRSLANIQIASSRFTRTLPSIVRMMDLLPGNPFAVDEVIDNWQALSNNQHLALFPVGQYVDRTNLTTCNIDFRPKALGGRSAYHAMIIGSAHSGKSILMQSMLLAAAHTFSPRQLNFMVMDFKAGAWEYQKICDLPHCSGKVSAFSPGPLDRGLQAVEHEISQRKHIFDEAGKITNIWEFNRQFPTQSMPHLLVSIDEFSEGIHSVPNLVERLKKLLHQGPTYGVNFILSSLTINDAVKELAELIGWHILFGTTSQEDLNLFGINQGDLLKSGRGYLKVDNDRTTFQSAYANIPARPENHDQIETGEDVIAALGPGGNRKDVYRIDPDRPVPESDTPTELDLLVNTILQAAQELDIPSTPAIYKEPMKPGIPLLDILRHSDAHSLFSGKEWKPGDGERNVIPLGMLNNLQRCEQIPFSLNLNEEGGHLWIIGGPASGKTFTLQSLAAILSLTHTPAEAQLYVLDFDSGGLACLADLPHTGAVLRIHEKERVKRLFQYLKRVQRERSDHPEQMPGKALFLIVNNIFNFRYEYPEQMEELERLISDRSAAGIHVILTSSSGSDLMPKFSRILNHRLVLQMMKKQDLLDVLNTMPPPLTMHTEGRGYHVFKGTVTECQVAMPDARLLSAVNQLQNPSDTTFDRSQKAKDFLLPEIPSLLQDLGKQMRAAWKGALPEPIPAMEDTLSLPTLQSAVAQMDPTALPDAPIPLGLLYETLQPAVLDALGDSRFWSILGPRSSGKSTALLNLIYQLQQFCTPVIDVFLFRESPLSSLNGDHDLRIITDTAAMIERLKTLPEDLTGSPDRLHVLLMDDPCVAFSTKYTPLINAINDFHAVLSEHRDGSYLVVISDLVENLRSALPISSKFMRAFQCSQTGLFLSRDDADMAWFRARINFHFRREEYWRPGRGFLAFRGKIELVQTPLVTVEDLLRGRSSAMQHS